MDIFLRHSFDVNPDTWWDRLFFDRDFNRHIYMTELRFPDYEILSDEERGGERLRKVKVVPPQDAPAAIKKLAPGTFSYIEEGRFDKASRIYRMKITPSVLESKIRIEGQIGAEPIPGNDKKMTRITQMTVSVSMFGVGGLLESFLGKSIQESFEKSVGPANRYIADKGL